MRKIPVRIREKDGVMDSTGARVNDTPDAGSNPAPSNSQSLELHEEQTTDVKCCRTFQSGSSTSKDTLQSFKKVDEGHVAGFVQEHIGKSNSDKCLGDARHSSCDTESTTMLLDSSSRKRFGCASRWCGWCTKLC